MSFSNIAIPYWYQSKIQSNQIYWNLNCAFEVWQVVGDLFKTQASLPIEAKFLTHCFLELFGGDNVYA